ncbi:hypothetical protein MBM_04260 [Drepanopeziza brunnea f. sp. 'multigermtubi' MB_m1]|uniref:Uncharacterized protein n=1 Tax=Marssonina brunnea f. sp. multigermtubi (strain MB_m1) TaxID=1072389 RepID=K1XX84_MARBU|nr:uncharacterized protein MBM_04260 [Drepanopeziza brunnea f. sp. 'multigermtubi' MB_m1]EKD17399.1 hypothetical protein MBM_04260 [Drepanopeziza brunnea f. sp. 'multigermtubi' MB_m1]
MVSLCGTFLVPYLVTRAVPFNLDEFYLWSIIHLLIESFIVLAAQVYVFFYECARVDDESTPEMWLKALKTNLDSGPQGLSLFTPRSPRREQHIQKDKERFVWALHHQGHAIPYIFSARVRVTFQLWPYSMNYIVFLLTWGGIRGLCDLDGREAELYGNIEWWTGAIMEGNCAPEELQKIVVLFVIPNTAGVDECQKISNKCAIPNVKVDLAGDGFEPIPTPGSDCDHPLICPSHQRPLALRNAKMLAAMRPKPMVKSILLVTGKSQPALQIRITNLHTIAATTIWTLNGNLSIGLLTPESIVPVELLVEFISVVVVVVIVVTGRGQRTTIGAWTPT